MTTIREFLKKYTDPSDADDTLWTATLGDLRRWAEMEELAEDLLEDAMELRGVSDWKDGSTPRYQAEYDELSERIEKGKKLLRPGEATS